MAQQAIKQRSYVGYLRPAGWGYRTNSFLQSCPLTAICEHMHVHTLNKYNEKATSVCHLHTSASAKADSLSSQSIRSHSQIPLPPSDASLFLPGWLFLDLLLSDQNLKGSPFHPCFLLFSPPSSSGMVYLFAIYRLPPNTERKHLAFCLRPTF